MPYPSYRKRHEATFSGVAVLSATQFTIRKAELPPTDGTNISQLTERISADWRNIIS